MAYAPAMDDALHQTSASATTVTLAPNAKFQFAMERVVNKHVIEVYAPLLTSVPAKTDTLETSASSSCVSKYRMPLLKSAQDMDLAPNRMFAIAPMDSEEMTARCPYASDMTTLTTAFAPVMARALLQAAASVTAVTLARIVKCLYAMA